MHNLYRERILDLYKHPLNFKVIEDAKQVHLTNPLCGDEITLYLLVDKDVIVDASFQGRGCALCIASSSLLSEKIKGLKPKEVLEMNREDIKEMLQIDVGANRLKCILLSLEAAKKVVEENYVTH